MFSGIIEDKGKVVSLTGNNGYRISILSAKIAAGASAGESIAVNGVCLTISKLERSLASLDVSLGKKLS